MSSNLISFNGDCKIQYKKSEILLTCCDGDTSEAMPARSPSQLSFTGHTWIIATYRKRDGHKWGVISTANGIALEDELIDTPYDIPIEDFDYNIKALHEFNANVRNVLMSNSFLLVVIFCGANQLEKYFSRIYEIANPLGIDVLGFGKPCCRDIKSLPSIFKLLETGTTLNQIDKELNHPECRLFAKGVYSLKTSLVS